MNFAALPGAPTSQQVESVIARMRCDGSAQNTRRTLGNGRMPDKDQTGLAIIAVCKQELHWVCKVSSRCDDSV